MSRIQCLRNIRSEWRLSRPDLTLLDRRASLCLQQNHTLSSAFASKAEGILASYSKYAQDDVGDEYDLQSYGADKPPSNSRLANCHANFRDFSEMTTVVRSSRLYSRKATTVRISTFASRSLEHDIRLGIVVGKSGCRKTYKL